MIFNNESESTITSWSDRPGHQRIVRPPLGLSEVPLRERHIIARKGYSFRLPKGQLLRRASVLLYSLAF